MTTLKSISLRVFPKDKVTFLDITEQVRGLIKKSEVRNGAVHLYTRHTTTGIKINENEPNLVRDFQEFLESLIPTEKEYYHNQLHLRNCPADEPKNARSHLMALILGSSESIPFQEKELMLGTWQSIFFIDCDGGRPEGREIIATLIKDETN